jgi:DNA-binding NtrC family response regulator
MGQILIIRESNPDTEELKAVFREAGLTSEVAKGISAGCRLAKSGKFQVVFCTPLLRDGSWKRLIEVAQQDGLSMEVILLARTFNLNQWGEALQAGAFDVLDVLCDLPTAADAAKRALRVKRPEALAAVPRASV